MALLALAVAACSDSADNRATPTASVEPTSAPSPTPTPLPELGLQIGVRAALPVADPLDLAVRFGVTPSRAATAKPFAGEAALGDKRDFAVLRITSGALAGTSPPQAITISATLLAKSAHAYFYVDNALQPDASAVEDAAALFEAGAWPKVTAAFGEPEIPGVDGDPRIIVLQADLGGAVGGYFSGDDGYLRAVRPMSNEAEMVYLDRTLRPGGAAFDVVLAHELQHLIHAKNDRDEEVWVNEGLSETAAGLAGGAMSSVDVFASRPATQLNAWSNVGSAAHYGAGAAFFRYLASRFGGDASLGAVARAAADGAAGVDEFLAGAGQPLRFRDVFADWMAANILNRAAGPYANPERPVDANVEFEIAPGSSVDGSASQFGADYYRLSGLDAGAFVLRFRGEEETPVLPATPPTGASLLWANAGDDIDTRLTREVDLTAAAAPVLTFRAWYDIERWFDWGYVAASTDGGATWQALAGTTSSTDDPVRAAYGPGYTGKSGGGDEPRWIDERVSLAAFAGRKVLLRFEYVTDGATHGEGWAIDDVALEGAAGALDDAGWTSEGWVRIDRPLRQSYVVRLILERAGGEAEVLDVPLDSSQRGELRFDAAGVEDAVVAIAGTTEGTNQKAPYTLEMARP